MSNHTIIWIMGIAIVILGVVLFWWSTFRDRSRGRRRCPRCWYLMNTPGTLRCSECGHQAACQKDLLRTRRRWRWAAVGTLIIAAGIWVGPWQLVRREGWVGLVPNTLLVLWVDQTGDEEALLALERRAPEGVVVELLWSWQADWLAQTSIEWAIQNQSAAYRILMLQSSAELLEDERVSRPAGLDDLIATVLAQDGDDHIGPVMDIVEQLMPRLDQSDSPIVAAMVDLLVNGPANQRLALLGQFWQLRWSQSSANSLGTALASLLSDDSEDVRLLAAGTLAQLEPPPNAAMDRLTSELSDAPPDIRRWIAVALGHIGEPARPAIGELLQLAKLNPHEPGADRCILAVGQIGTGGDQSIIDSLKSMALDPDHPLRGEALAALGSSEETWALIRPLVIDGLKDEQAEMQLNALRALEGRSIDEELIRVIGDYLADQVILRGWDSPGAIMRAASILGAQGPRAAMTASTLEQLLHRSYFAAKPAAEALIQIQAPEGETVKFLIDCIGGDLYPRMLIYEWAIKWLRRVTDKDEVLRRLRISIRSELHAKRRVLLKRALRELSD